MEDATTAALPAIVAATAAPAPVPAVAATAAPQNASNQRHHRKTHCCSCCDSPVDLYGRLLPCTHAFCLVCANSMTTCYICSSRIARLEKVSAEEGGIFVSPLTLQSFKTEADLARHTQQAYARLMAMPQGVLAAGRSGGAGGGGGGG